MGGTTVNVKVFWATLLKRWYFTFLAVAVAAAATYLVVGAIGPKYEAQGGVLFYPPILTTKNSTETLGNPYLQLGGLSQARDVVVRALNSQDTRIDLCAGSAPLYAGMRAGMCRDHPTVSYEAGPDFTNSAPIVLITVDAENAGDATATLGALMDRTPAILRSLQTQLGLPDKALITSSQLMVDRTATVVRKDQIRGGVVAGAGALALGLVLVALGDGLATAWRRRRPKTAKKGGPDWWDGTADDGAEGTAPGEAGATSEDDGAAPDRKSDERDNVAAGWG